MEGVGVWEGGNGGVVAARRAGRAAVHLWREYAGSRIERAARRAASSWHERPANVCMNTASGLPSI